VLQHILNISRWLQPVGFGRFDQLVTSGTGTSTLRSVGKEPGFSTQGKRADGVLRQRIADVQITALAVTHQIIPLVQGVLHGDAGQGAFHDLAHARFQSRLERGQLGQAQLLADAATLTGAGALDLTLDGVEFVDVAQGHIRFGGFAFFAFCA